MSQLVRHHATHLAGIEHAQQARGGRHGGVLRGVPLGDKIAQAARDFALEVLAGAPVAVDVVCIDRAGQLVGRSRRAGPGTPARGGE